MAEEGFYVFEVKDRLGRTVRLRRSVYHRHLPKHPEMAEYLEEAKLTIADPDFEIYDDEDGSYNLYRFELGRDKFKRCFIRVPIHYRETFWGEEGEVATFFLTRRPASGRRVWTRHES